jgi:ribonuclease P protein component
VYLHARNDLEPSRVGIVVGKRTGKATIRNRVKRRIREAARTLYPTLPLGQDVVVIAKPAAAEASAKGLLEVLEAILTRAGARA